MEEQDLRDLIVKYPSKILHISDENQVKHVIGELWAVALDTAESKSLRKAAKKALYMAKSRGIDIESIRPKVREKPEKEEPEKEIHTVFLTTPDSESNFLLIVVLSNARTSALEFLQFLINPDSGVLKYTSFHSGKKHLDKLQAENSDFFKVPAHYGLYKLNKALKKTDKDKISGLGKLPKALLQDAYPVQHPVLDLVPVRISRVLNPEYEKKVFGLKEIARLSLSKEEMREYREEIEAAKKSKLIVHGRSPDERVADILEKVYSTYFTPEKKAHYREVLLDIALFFYNRDSEEYSRLLVEYANRLLNATTPAKEHPFLSFLVYKELMVR